MCGIFQRLSEDYSGGFFGVLGTKSPFPIEVRLFFKSILVYLCNIYGSRICGVNATVDQISMNYKKNKK